MPRRVIGDIGVACHRSAAQHPPIVIRFGRMGDMVMLEPLLRLLHRRYAQRCWLIGSGPWSKALFGRHVHVARVWSLAGRHTPLLLGPGWWRALWALRRSPQSPIYICEDTDAQVRRIRRLLQLAGIGTERCIFQQQTPALPEEHCIDALLRLGNQTPPALGTCPPIAGSLSAAPHLVVPEAAHAAARSWLRAQGALDRRVVLVQPGNRRTMRRGDWQRGEGAHHKCWPLGRWADLLRQMREAHPDLFIVLCGTRREQSLLRRIRAAAGGDGLALMRSSPSRLLGLCAAAHSMISVDTGPAHLAASVGTPLVVLFGANLPQCWAPRSARYTPVISLGGPPTSSHVRDIAVAAVFAAWQSLLPCADQGRVAGLISDPARAPLQLRAP